MKSSRPFFTCARELAPSPWSQPLMRVDRFWLTGARDEGGSGDTLDSEVCPEPRRRVL
jgi:hypothetical protein